jgi:hypothetical protein
MTMGNVFRHKQSLRKGQPLSSDDGNNEKTIENLGKGHRNVKKTMERLGRGIECVFS